MKCRSCNGTGVLLARNGIDFPFSPGLSSTVGYTCPRCDGFKIEWHESLDQKNEVHDDSTC